MEKKIKGLGKGKINLGITILIKVLFLCSLFFLFSGITTVWIGLHNMDLCSNERAIALKYGITDLKEIDVYGNVWTLEQCYISGMKGLIGGIYISIISAFATGYLLLLSWVDIKNETPKNT